MDAVKLKNSCVCGNIRPYLECCGRFAQIPDAKITGEYARAWAEFRHAFHELYMYLFPLRNLYQAYWEKLSQEKYPHHLLMADPDYGRMVMANFFWDYSVQYSDARPILRAARDLEAKDLRMANDFRLWSLSPAWIYFVVESDRERGHVRMLGTGKVHRVLHGGELSEPGSFIIARIIPYRGEQVLHPAVLPLSGQFMDEAFLEEKLRGICQGLGLNTGTGLRPDIHCEEWRSHGALFLALWREIIYDEAVGVPSRSTSSCPVFEFPAGSDEDPDGLLEKSGATRLGPGRFEMRYRALPVARLESKPGRILVTLMDAAYRAHVMRTLTEIVHPHPENRDPELLDGAPPQSPAEFDAWIHSPLPALNGQTPVQASNHDFGRRRLNHLLREFSVAGRDVSALRRQLGL